MDRLTSLVTSAGVGFSLNTRTCPHRPNSAREFGGQVQQKKLRKGNYIWDTNKEGHSETK